MPALRELQHGVRAALLGDEACVAAFLTGRISFPRIVDTVARVVSEHDASSSESLTLEDVLAVDAWARARAVELNAVAKA